MLSVSNSTDTRAFHFDPVHDRFRLAGSRTSNLKGVLRVKLGRHRIFYLCNRHRTIILFIGWREDGAVEDAYEAAAKRIRAGRFDAAFRELNLELPPARTS
jgi:hypothetical protein